MGTSSSQPCAGQTRLALFGFYRSLRAFRCGHDHACAFIDEAETIGAVELRVNDTHAKAMKSVITAKAKSNGGELGKQLVTSLHALAAKILKDE